MPVTRKATFAGRVTTDQNRNFPGSPSGSKTYDPTSSAFASRRTATSAAPSGGRISREELALFQRQPGAAPSAVSAATRGSTVPSVSAMAAQSRVATPAPAASPTYVGGAALSAFGTPAPALTPAPESSPLAPLDQLSEQELEAQLAAIEARFGMTRAELLADRSRVGATYALILRQLEQTRQDALIASQAGFAERGILQSGLYASDVARVHGQFGLAASQAQEEQAITLSEINQRLALLESQMTAEQAQATVASGQRQLSEEELLALAAGR